MSIFLLFLWHRAKLFRSKNSDAFILFFLFALFSIIGYLYNDLPLPPYISEVSSFILPMVFYFITSSNAVNREKFYSIVLNSVIFCFILGLICFILNPPQYIQYIIKIADSTYEGQVEGGALYIRFQSFFGSTVTGTLGVVGTIILLDKFRNKAFLYLRSKLWYIFGYFVLFVGTMLSSQRSAMVCELAVVTFFIIESLLLNKRSDKLFILFNFLVIVIVSGYLMAEYSDKIDYLLERLLSVDEGLSGRDDQWKETFSNSCNLLTGTGLGSAGLYAMPYTNFFISDGALFKMIAEFGIVGFAFFVFIIASRLLKKIKYFNSFFIEFSIIAVYILQSIASNTLYFQQLLPIFWFAVGILSTKQLINIQWKL